ncbi:MAG: aminoacyl-tRNA hydrolase [Acidobacteria bacterium]|uniref:Peptidyl-tRNA hydrolase n=1 Tax=Candidatus Sulfomarinibacter kjeldsenii TaxID=2885994 RepID=A0A8J6YB01_9BACT|nr:aminoacyl-tRNA hydrolase [Candidatus Sulfomarinibacter kjeldsenii]MBD3870106.1 aminoacyl-tRNA hydrolase [Candidatus Sulfomarinibacter kjeldsenii]
MTIDLVLGLGNPGVDYRVTRHNIGFRVIEEVARRHGVSDWEQRPSCELAVITAGRFVLLSRPLTYMNRSGEAMRWLLEEFGLTPESMLVVVDDVDLPLANLRLRRSGGPGTHNGLRSLCEEVGTGFPRLRVGVRGDDMTGDLADYVLSSFTEEEANAAKAAVERAADAVETVLRNRFERAMNKYNRPPTTDEL